jgi:hypothetical protein
LSIPAEYYDDLRAVFAPKEVSLILLFESPPEGGNYFYDPEGKTTEALFKAVMKLWGWHPETKSEGLQLLRSSGVVLIDATYKQVNKMTPSQRRDIMRLEYEQLCERLPDAPILIGMVKVLEAVGQRLVDDGFKVLNSEVRIPFPSHGNQHKFHSKALDVLEGARKL